MTGKLLSHDTIGEGDRRIFFLHGIYGAGRNWASVARRLVRERPELAVLLVDLRQHGESQGFPPPHTIAAAADDLAALAAEVGAPVGVLGHSFGGKVALEYARRHPEGLEHVWVVDSTPDAREPQGSAWEMLHVLRSLSPGFDNRAQAVAALQDAGVAEGVANWMATNLAERDGRWRWQFDLGDMELLLRDFFRSDLWNVIEQPPGGAHVHLIKAEESSILDPEAVARIETAAGESGRVTLDVVAGGHWVNADNPDALHALLLRDLPAGAPEQETPSR